MKDFCVLWHSIGLYTDSLSIIVFIVENLNCETLAMLVYETRVFNLCVIAALYVEYLYSYNTYTQNDKLLNCMLFIII